MKPASMMRNHRDKFPNFNSRAAYGGLPLKKTDAYEKVPLRIDTNRDKSIFSHFGLPLKKELLIAEARKFLPPGVNLEDPFEMDGFIKFLRILKKLGQDLPPLRKTTKSTFPVVHLQCHAENDDAYFSWCKQFLPDTISAVACTWFIMGKDTEMKTPMRAEIEQAPQGCKYHHRPDHKNHTPCMWRISKCILPNVIDPVLRRWSDFSFCEIVSILTMRYGCPEKMSIEEEKKVSRVLDAVAIHNQFSIASIWFVASLLDPAIQ
jgi:hypothetical protein